MTHFFTPLIAYVVPQHVRICDGLRKNADSCATRNLNFMGRKAVLIVQHHPTAAASRAVITFRNRIFQLLKFRHTDAQHFRNTAHEVFSRRASVADGGGRFNGWRGAVTASTADGGIIFAARSACSAMLVNKSARPCALAVSCSNFSLASSVFNVTAISKSLFILSLSLYPPGNGHGA